MAMFSPDYANASSWAWNVTTDRQLPWQHSVQLSYVGRSASNLERARNINQLQPGTIQANPGVNANALRPYKGFGTITLYETTGKSRYNAMQLAVCAAPRAGSATRSPTRCHARRTTAARASRSCPTPTMTAATTAPRRSIGRTS